MGSVCWTMVSKPFQNFSRSHERQLNVENGVTPVGGHKLVCRVMSWNRWPRISALEDGSKGRAFYIPFRNFLRGV